jgi:hypothetical protein
MAIATASVFGSTGDRRYSIPTPTQLRLLERDDLQPRVELRRLGFAAQSMHSVIEILIRHSKLDLGCYADQYD